SSRRRHTRFSRDWSSDVCSSDLHRERVVAMIAREHDAVAIHDFAATRRNRDHRDAILLRARRQAFVTYHLQMPEARAQKTEAEQRENAGHPGAHHHALALLLRRLLEFEHGVPQTAPPSPSSRRRCGICSNTSTSGHSNAMKMADHSQPHPSHSPASQPSMSRLADLAMTKTGSMCTHCTTELKRSRR